MYVLHDTVVLLLKYQCLASKGVNAFQVICRGKLVGSLMLFTVPYLDPVLPFLGTVLPCLGTVIPSLDTVNRSFTVSRDSNQVIGVGFIPSYIRFYSL